MDPLSAGIIGGLGLVGTLASTGLSSYLQKQNAKELQESASKYTAGGTGTGSKTDQLSAALARASNSRVRAQSGQQPAENPALAQMDARRRAVAARLGRMGRGSTIGTV